MAIDLGYIEQLHKRLVYLEDRVKKLESIALGFEVEISELHEHVKSISERSRPSS